MSIDKIKFQSGVPSVFYSVLEVLKSFGLCPTLVGGSVRDFFLTGELGHDWDIELSHSTIPYSKDLWKELGKGLSRIGKVSFLTYDVLRLDCPPYQFEFSPPRIEIFSENWHEKGHSNFEVIFDFKLPFSKAVSRRDFTINAMGIQFITQDDFVLLDPLDGLIHLRQKILYPAGENFSKDPVRFLRAIRFSLRFGFNLSRELRSVLETMPVSTFTSRYLWTEMQKSKNPIGFYQNLLEWARFHPSMKIPMINNKDVHFEQIRKFNLCPDKLESWIISLEWSGIDSAPWQEYFLMAPESTKKIIRWVLLTKKFIVIRPEFFHGDFDQIKDKQEFEFLFDWYFATKQLLQKHSDLLILKIIQTSLPHWSLLYQFSPLKDVKHIDPPYRAKYQVWNLCQRL